MAFQSSQNAVEVGDMFKRPLSVFFGGGKRIEENKTDEKKKQSEKRRSFDPASFGGGSLEDDTMKTPCPLSFLVQERREKHGGDDKNGTCIQTCNGPVICRAHRRACVAWCGYIMLLIVNEITSISLAGMAVILLDIYG